MLRFLHIENFKAFGKRTLIPFAPITLIFGENSAGKSSILQALNLLKQSFESKESGSILISRAEDGLVDLGSFQELLFDHDLVHTLSLRLGFDLPDKVDRYLTSQIYAIGDFGLRGIPRLDFDKANRYHNKPLYEKNRTGALELQFTRHSIEQEIQLKQLEIFLPDHKTVARYALIPREEESIIDGLIDRLLQYGYKMQCTHVTDDPELWRPFFETTKDSQAKTLALLEELKQYVHNHIKDSTQRMEFENDYGPGAASDGILLLEEEIAFYSSDFGFEEYVERMRGFQHQTALYFDGLVQKSVNLPRDFVDDFFTKHHYFDSFMRGHNRLRHGIDVLGVTHFVRHAFEQALHSLFPMGPYRKPSARWYIFRGTSPPHVGYEGELLPDFLLRNTSLVREVNSWLQRLDIGYRLEIKSTDLHFGDFFEARLQDLRRKKSVDVSLKDVGFGISQILPFIVQSLVGQRQIISIEQPEVHIHPRLQADIGELLAESIRPPRENQFLIETHSEHLVLRLQRLVREGRLKARDVAIVYISRGETGSQAHHLRLDDEGEFIDDWPGGFFLERLRELV